jgi:5-methylcytosine-specific restriction endonuclease McrA
VTKRLQVENLYCFDGIIRTSNLINVPAMLETSGNVVNPVRRIGMSILTQKKCAGCGEWKPISEFRLDRRSQGQYRSKCEECRNPKPVLSKTNIIHNLSAFIHPVRSREMRKIREGEAGGKRIGWYEWGRILRKYGARCLCCGVEGVTLTQDHVLPISMGGKTVPENIQPLCVSCNSRKNDRYIDYRPDYIA